MRHRVHTDPSPKEEYSAQCTCEPTICRASPEVHTDLDSHVAYTSHSDVTVYSSWKIQFGLSLLILTASEFIGPVWAEVDVQIELCGPEA